MASTGILDQISFAKESTWGTAVTPTKSVAVRPTDGIAINPNIALQPAIRAQLQKNYVAIPGKNVYQGSYTMDAFADYICYLILSAMGTDTPATHAGETIVYDHVFTESGAGSKPSLTIEQSIGENTRRFAGCIVSDFKISGKVGEMIQFTATIMSKTQATSTEISGAFSTVPAFNHTQMVVKIGGSSIGEVENFELEFSNGLELVYTLGNKDPQYQSISGGSEVKGKFDLVLDNTTLTRYTNYLANTHESVEFIATGVAIGSAANYVLDALVPEAVYTTVDSKITDAHNILSCSFEGLYNAGSGKLLGMTITNLLATLS